MSDKKPDEDVEPGWVFEGPCPQRSESARKAAETRAHEDTDTLRRRTPSLDQRLSLGFELLNDDGLGADDDDE